MQFCWMLAILCVNGTQANAGAGEFSTSKIDSLPEIQGLPDPFLMNDGRRVSSRKDWEIRREEIKSLLLGLEYGHMPPTPVGAIVEDQRTETAFDGSASETRGTLAFGPEKRLKMPVCLYVPSGGAQRFPVVLAFEPVWKDDFKPLAERMVARGYIFAGFDAQTIDRDDADRSDGAHPLFPDCDWGTLAVWAWSAMRAVDYLVSLDSVDAEKIALFGHSRRGKVALLASAMDERIALAVPHCSGAGGSGSYRILGPGSESLSAITDPKRFHYWFHPRLREFAGQESRLPFDQHFLKALVAPRAILSLEATGDLWANPSGTQQIHTATQPVYEFLGVKEKLAIYYHEGGHDVIDEDWDVLLEFADHLFFGRPLQRPFNILPFADQAKAFNWDAPSGG